MRADTDRKRNPAVLILGASTRAAAQSALRAGLDPLCADQFSDRDLVACARVLEVADYPLGLVSAAAAAPSGPWMYTGGLENHPRIIEQISKSRPLWGNSGDVLRRSRDPWHVALLLMAQGLPGCEVWPRDCTPPVADGRWMLKPLRSAAGRGIRIWKDLGTDEATLHEPHYFQERRCGVPFSALFLALRQHTALLGITRQLVGLHEVHAPPFAWCGTIMPVTLPVDTVAMMAEIGAVLAQDTGLRGLFGCDFIIDQGQPWLTEVNPRYPASTELVERVLQAPLLDWHRRACESFDDAGRQFVVPASGRMAEQIAGSGSSREQSANAIGKIVLYASRDLAAPDAMRFVRQLPRCDASGELDGALPYMADIAASGTRIAKGQPICTFYARAASESECQAKLIRRAVRFEAQIK